VKKKYQGDIRGWGAGMKKIPRAPIARWGEKRGEQGTSRRENENRGEAAYSREVHGTSSVGLCLSRVGGGEKKDLSDRPFGIWPPLATADGVKTGGYPAREVCLEDNKGKANSRCLNTTT